jgi:hypothetical protein
MSITRHAEIWLPGYIRSRIRRRLSALPRPERLWLTIADHFEPYWHRPTDELAEERVLDWRRRWPEIAARNVDSTGRPAQYSFFYPEEEYKPRLMDLLAEMVHAGLGAVEIHLHHDRDTQAAFLERTQRFVACLANAHGLLQRVDGRPMFAFIHGNWALDNSSPDGRWCGLNNEITLLRDLGCYADLTMPSGDHATQVHQVNSIYWAIDDPLRPKSHDRGPIVEAGRWEPGDLLMIPGPIGPRWEPGRWRPKLEAGELAHRDPATPRRVRGWLDMAPRVGADIFLKLHTHGTQERTRAALLGGVLDETFRLIADECRRRGIALHFATAWDLREAVERAARAVPVAPGLSDSQNR